MIKAMVGALLGLFMVFMTRLMGQILVDQAFFSGDYEVLNGVVLNIIPLAVIVGTVIYVISCVMGSRKPPEAGPGGEQ